MGAFPAQSRRGVRTILTPTPLSTPHLASGFRPTPANLARLAYPRRDRDCVASPRALPPYRIRMEGLRSPALRSPTTPLARALLMDRPPGRPWAAVFQALSSLGFPHLEPASLNTLSLLTSSLRLFSLRFTFALFSSTRRTRAVDLVGKAGLPWRAPRSPEGAPQRFCGSRSERPGRGYTASDVRTCSPAGHGRRSGPSPR
jgi:hypothetical protein